MKHDIAFYRRGLDGNDFPLAVIPWAMAAVAMFVGIPLLIEEGIWLVEVIGMAVAVLNTLLYNTHVNRSMSYSQRELFGLWKQLDKNSKRMIGLSAQDVTKITGSDVGTLRVKIGNLISLENERKTLEAKNNPKILRAIDTLTTLNSAAEENLEAAQEKNKAIRSNL